jgi:hypothetical protein
MDFACGRPSLPARINTTQRKFGQKLVCFRRGPFHSSFLVHYFFSATDVSSIRLRALRQGSCFPRSRSESPVCGATLFKTNRVEEAPFEAKRLLDPLPAKQSLPWCPAAWLDQLLTLELGVEGLGVCSLSVVARCAIARFGYARGARHFRQCTTACRFPSGLAVGND